ncbi:MAG: NAD(P)H-dependent oxidoreductase [Verrucomicrobia subdivision 3 bacterium]|nr:NAD(P)H-dependent oxidoreductase [Limisphaerales bacterium]
MSEPLNVLAVVGSLNKVSSTRFVVNVVARQLRDAGAHVDVLDLLGEPLALFNPETFQAVNGFPELKARVDRADVFVLGTPDYHGSMSSTIKNFLDHFWHEFAGKLFATIVASHEKGLTVTDQLRTVARQCYAWSLPYGASFAEGIDVKGEEIVSDALRSRLEMLVRDVRIYGEVIARQRKADLAGNEPGFMARWRKQNIP